MAERRMFAKTIVLSDEFLDMPLTARCLYFTLGMLADDDGFVNSPKSIMRQCGSSQDDMNILISKKFVILFDSGVIVIKHWRINNYLRNDRYVETKYTEEKALLAVKDNGSYTMKNTSGIPNTVYPDKHSIGKVSTGNNSKQYIPTLEEVNTYLTQKGNIDISAQEFVNKYNANGWTIDGKPIKNWKNVLNGWIRQADKRWREELDEDLPF